MKIFERMSCWDGSLAVAKVRSNVGRCTSLVTLSLLLAASGGAVHAQQAKQPAKPPSKAAASTGEPLIEPKAIDLLKAMSSRLAAARSMTFTVLVTYESPSRLGPALVYTTISEVTMQRPDKLRVITPGDGPASEFYYDGKTMAAFAPAENLVAVATAATTIDETSGNLFSSGTAAKL